MFALLLVAASVGMSNFAAAIAIGVSGVDAKTRLRVGLVFGTFEAGMPIVGLVLGKQVAGPLGHAARWVGAGLLIAVGCYALVSAARGQRSPAAGGPARPVRLGHSRLLLSGLALSLDNLVVGFALGTYNTSIIEGAIVIGAVSVVLSLIGLELGARIGRWAGERGEQLAGVMLISVGIAIAAGALG
jgi:putative Mn2+ efflux pump MntP